ncbi:capZ-interacting protein [Pipistrellus kuhlii]|uniref:capZ-interacting protein n=1 Tax=Pipistrellus kuhlii TaxID=59472 RepID=UPI00174F6F99|nr:capZ-interacting protein [Pipistrellus kuhlii]
MEERPAETNANVDSSASPSVAQLAGRFREQAAAKEMPASKPARRKPPCSLPLFPPKVELGQNGEEKSPHTSHLPKVKVKSSPLIEKLQANLAFDPAALLPGASPKSPGLKAVVSPFHSPPSTPTSPGVCSRASKPEEVPISFDQPPEGSHLPCYNKVRTRGSIKRRPPSRRFRKSQSEYGELGDFRAPESSQENGAQEEAGDEVFQPKNKAPGSPQPSEEAGRDGSRNLESHERPPLKRTDKQEGEAPAPAKATPEQLPEKAAPDAQEEATPPPKGPSTEAPGSEAESGCGSPEEARPAPEQREEAPEQREEAAAAKAERASRAGEPAQQSLDTQQLEEKSGGQESPQSPPEGVEGSLTPAEGTDKEKQEEGAVLEPGCHPRTGSKVSEKEGNTPAQDTRM